MRDIEVVVQSILPSNEPQGRYHLRVFPDITVEDLLAQLCQEAGALVKPEYCLRSRGHNILNLTDTLIEAGLQSGAFLHWTNNENFTDAETKTTCVCNNFWALALVSFVIGTVGIVTVCVLKFRQQDPVYDFAVVFDAGSSHTAMFVYRWEGSKLNGTAVASQFGSKCTAEGGGVSSYADSPEDAGKSLQSCIDQAKSAIPSDKYSLTPIYLGATAGMRLLEMVNATAAQAILTSIRKTFSQTPFKFTDPSRAARIISGAEEGTCSWITSNYVTNAFKVRPGSSKSAAYVIVPSIGALDLGGASTQITFIPGNISGLPANYSIASQLFGHNYTMYTHSYLCYGAIQVVARVYAALVQKNENASMIQHPCLPIGYNTTMSYNEIFESPCTTQYQPRGSYVNVDKNYTFRGAGNNTECRIFVNHTLFNHSFCGYDRCSFNGVYQPEVHGLFYAFSSFFYVADFLNLTSGGKSIFSYQDFLLVVDKICDSSWDELLPWAKTQEELSNLMDYCTLGNYIHLLLTDGYGFTNTTWPNLNFVGQVAGTDVGWSLGFVLNESLAYPRDVASVALTTTTFAFLLALFGFFLVVSIGLAAHGKRFRQSLEKQTRRMSHYGAI